MTTAWKPQAALTVSSILDARFLFKFASKADWAKVVSNGPWHIDHDLLIVKSVSLGEQYSSTPLSEFELTVRVYDLPFENRSTKNLMGTASNPNGDRITVTLSPQPRRSSPASRRSPAKTIAASPAASSQVSIPGINCKNSNAPTVSISPFIRKLLNDINGLVIAMPACSANRSVQDNPRLILSAVTEDNKLGQDDDEIPSDLAKVAGYGPGPESLEPSPRAGLLDCCPEDEAHHCAQFEASDGPSRARPKGGPIMAGLSKLLEAEDCLGSESSVGLVMSLARDDMSSPSSPSLIILAGPSAPSQAQQSSNPNSPLSVHSKAMSSFIRRRCTSPESPASPPASLSPAAPPPSPSKAPPSASLRSTSPSNKGIFEAFRISNSAIQFDSSYSPIVEKVKSYATIGDVLRFGNRKRSNEVFSLEEADFEEETEKNLHKKLQSASSFSSPTTVQAPFSYIVRYSKEYYRKNKKKSSVTITPIPVSQEIADSTKEGVHSPNGPEAAAALQPRLTK